MDERPFWRTEIGRVRPNEILIRGYDLVELIGTRSFGDVAFLLLSGDMPRGNEGRMVEALLVAAAEHSLVAPSVDAARFVASAGVPSRRQWPRGPRPWGSTMEVPSTPPPGSSWTPRTPARPTGTRRSLCAVA